MSYAMKLALFLLALPSITWVLYLAVMSLKRVRDAGLLTWPMRLVGYPLLYVGLMVDIAFNVVVGSLSFLELPRETLFTSRVSRWIHDDTWRGDVARFYCRHFLDPFDPDGKHCK